MKKKLTKEEAEAFAALFRRCLQARYTTVENDGDFAVQREGNELFLLFQWSKGTEDWKNNFNFPAKPYKDMELPWLAHGGFLKVWKSIEPYLAETVADVTVRKITIAGYSHGAAVALFCHEYVWYHRPDLRKGLLGVGFGCPRCYFGLPKKKLMERWQNFYVLRNANDIVTHLPPVLLGFRHVTAPVCIGRDGKMAAKETKFAFVNAHYSENYLFSLQRIAKEE